MPGGAVFAAPQPVPGYSPCTVITGHRTMAGQATTPTLATPIKPRVFLLSLSLSRCLPSSCSSLSSPLSSLCCPFSLLSLFSHPLDPILSFVFVCFCYTARCTLLGHCTNTILVLLLIGLIPPAFHEIFPSSYSSLCISIGLLFIVPFFFSSSRDSIPARSPWASSEMSSTTLSTPRN